MTPTEWNLVKRVALLVLLAALFPLGALLYRFFFETSEFVSASPSVTPVLYTLVPGQSSAAPVPSATPTAIVLVVPSGWNELAAPDSSFAIAVPPRWQRLPINAQELDASLQVIRRSNPELATALGARGQELMASGVKLWAFDFDPDSLQTRFATNLTITRQSLQNPVSFDTYVLVNVGQIEQLASRQGPVAHERAALGNLTAERIRYSLSIQGSDGSPITSAITQYLVLSRSTAYVLTYATLLDQLDRYRPVFDQSAASFRLLTP